MMVMAQRVVIPGQNQIYRFLEDPAYTSKNEEYNMTGLLQVSNSDIAQTSQYLAGQLAFFDNIVFGIDYARHSYDVMRYTQMNLNNRIRLGLGDYYKYINIGVSLGFNRLNEVRSSKENNLDFQYRFAAHYTNYNLTLGGLLHYYPIENDLSLGVPNALSATQAYALFVAYDIALSDNLRLTPQIRYNSFKEIDQNIFETIALLNYKGVAEFAASYKNDYALNVVASAKFFKRAKLSYSFEKAIGSQNFNDVHAIGVSIDLAAEATDLPEWLVNVKRNRIKINNIKYKKPEKVEVAVKDTLVQEPEIIVKVEDTLATEAQVAAEELIKYPPMQEEDPADTVNGSKLKPGYYIILGSFKNATNAKKEVERLKSEGLYARYGKKSNTDAFNYVYVDRYTDRDIAIKRTRAKQQEKGLEKVWLMQIK